MSQQDDAIRSCEMM